MTEVSTDAGVTLNDWELLEAVRKVKNALPAWGDLSTPNQRDEHGRLMQMLSRIVSGLLNAPQDLAQYQELAAPVQLWVDHLRAWRKEFAERLASMPSRTDEDVLAQQPYVLAIQNIDRGCELNGSTLMAVPLRQKIMATYQPRWDMQSLDAWQVGFGCLPIAEDQLLYFRQRISLARRDLDGLRAAAVPLIREALALIHAAQGVTTG